MDAGAATQGTEVVVKDAEYREQYGFNDKFEYKFKTEKGLSEAIVREISAMKEEPEWMLEKRLAGYKQFLAKPTPQWGGDLNKIDYNDIYYYLKPTDKKSNNWDDVPQEIKNTFDKLGIPESERKFFAGAEAQYDSEVVYSHIRADLAKDGVIFVSTDEAVKKYPELMKKYFGTVIPPTDNKFAGLNTAVWSGGSFIYIPKGVKLKLPLQAYFRINTEKAGQFERTLIIADEGADVTYIEGCFTKGTEIITKQGIKLIENVSVGEIVLTHNLRYRKVYHAQVRPYTGNLYYIDCGGDTKVINATDEHPFLALIDGRKAWIPAKELKVGDTLIAANTQIESTVIRSDVRGSSMQMLEKENSGYDFVKVNKITHGAVANLPVYNFSVEEDESYVANGAFVHNCTAPIYISSSLHSAVVELVAHKDAHIRYVTIQNWSKNVYNLVTQRAFAYENAHVEWIDGNIGSKLNMKYPSVYLKERGARGEIMSIAVAGPGQVQDSGGKIYHLAPDTTSQIISKSVSSGDGVTTYRGLLHIAANASNVKSTVRCVKPDTILLGDNKSISCCSINDKVFGVSGLDTIIKTFENEFDGEMIKIYATGLFPIEVTPEHPILTVSSKIIYLIIERNGRKAYTERIKLSEPNWKLSSALKTKNSNLDGDYVLLPRLQGNTNIKHLDLSRFIIAKTATRRSGQLKQLKTRIGSLGLNLDEDLAWLFGIYTAEGYVSQGKLRFAFSGNEVELQNKVVEISKRIGYKSAVYKRPNENCSEVYVFSNLLSRAFKEWCGTGAANKQIPDFILDNKNIKIIEAFLDGYIKGDGCISKNCIGKRNVIHIVTISKLLAMQIQLLAARLGLFFRITKATDSPIIQGRHVNTHIKYDVRCNLSTKLQVKMDDKFIYIPIRKLEKIAYKGPVYNIETGNHNYLVSNIVTHNCDALLLDEDSKTNTYPYMEVKREDATITHEASTGKVGEEQLFYLMSRGMSEQDALTTIVLGFLDPLARALPLEYSIELRRLIKLDMSNSVG